jgi:cysteine desulfurase
MKSVYLDNAATTPLRKEVLEEMLPYLGAKFGNPNSLHTSGREAKEALEEARAKLAKRLNADPKEIVFTSGGTESNNFAIKGIAAQKPAGHIITSKIEHSSILAPLKHLEGHEIGRAHV